jgi:hypothetical protein
MFAAGSFEDAFLAALHDEARPRFVGDTGFAATLAELRAAAVAAYPDLTVAATTFAAELSRRLGAAASPDQLARIRADHVHIAIACAAGDPLAIRRFEAEFLDRGTAAGTPRSAR